MPPLNTLEFYFPNLVELNLSQNLLVSINAKELIKACPKLVKLDLSDNRIKDMRKIWKLTDLASLKSLDISNNPIDILSKRLCLLECMILEGIKPALTEKQVVGYLSATYSHVPRVRPGTALVSAKKKVFPNCTDEYKYQRDVLETVSVEQKELEGVLRMTSLTPRTGGNFRSLEQLNGRFITVQELQDVLYYAKFPTDYEKQREHHRRLQRQAQDEYQRSTLKKGAQKRP